MLTAEQIAQFHRDGFIILRGLIRGRELAELQRAATRVMEEGLAGRGSDHLYHTRPDGQKMYFRSEKMWDRDPIFRAATVHPELLECIGQCIGHPFLPLNDSFVCKVPEGNVPILWHQDPPYGFSKVPHAETFAIPNFDTDIYLDASTIANGCVWGIPGHHLVGHIDLSRFSQEELFDRFGAVPMVMEPGDVLFHSLSAPHGSIGNTTKSLRRIFYVHYMNQEVFEHCYGAWANDKRGFTPAGQAFVRQMLADREQLGLPGLEGRRIRLTDQGFEFTGQPTNPPRYWNQLIARIPPAEKQRLRQLAPAAAPA